jgi:membrane protein DedA with SNARE-associated domain
MPDITGPLVDLVTRWIGDYGALAVFLLMVAESACIPVPSEAIMIYGGFLVSQGKASLAAIIIAGVAGNLVGSLIAYWVGREKGREWVLRWHWLHVTPARLDRADRWFARYGEPAVLLGRLLPLVRTFISLPAGIARMPVWRFTVLTIIGCVPWVTALALAGRAVGDNWEQLQHYLRWVDYVIVLAAAAVIVWLVVRHRRRRAARPALADPADGAVRGVDPAGAPE